jgi:hypothetical protein
MAEIKSTLGVKLWKEVEPIAIHAVVVLVLEISILLIGSMTKLLEILLPDQKHNLLLVEVIDSWLALALVSLFGLYTLIQVGIRLARALVSEWSKSQPASEAE